MCLSCSSSSVSFSMVSYSEDSSRRGLLPLRTEAELELLWELLSIAARALLS